ncbi:MAG: hypothetical protein U0744_07205 [Gemmataceae bacterium]
MRWAIAVAALVAVSPLFAVVNAPAALTDFRGKVVPLADLLAKQNIKLDADAGPTSLALATDEGRIYPLIKDAGARMFFKDAKLLHRPMVLSGQLAKGSELLQVVTVRSLKDGKLHDVYYWCDICTIKTFEAGPCDCCGAPMELRETPVKR